eukprot:6419408-Amphidinium_carterae.1
MSALRPQNIITHPLQTMLALPLGRILVTVIPYIQTPKVKNMMKMAGGLAVANDSEKHAKIHKNSQQKMRWFCKDAHARSCIIQALCQRMATNGFKELHI